MAIASAAGIDPAQLANRILEMNHNKRGRK